MNPLNVITRLFIRLGLKADAATLLGFALSIPAAYFIAHGRLIAGAAFIALSGLMDLVDGRIARLLGPSKFGALFDSSLDRLSDALYYGAIVFYFTASGDTIYAVLAFSAAAGAFEISYIRARAEGLGISCRTGFWERGERIALILAALVLDNLYLAVVYLGVLTHFTALRRLLYARDRLAGAPEAPQKGAVRAAWPWRIQAAFYLLTLVIVRP